MESTTRLPVLRLPEGLPLQVVALQEHFDPLGTKPHINDYYLLLWVTAGEGSLMTGWQRYELAAGSLFFIHPAQVHQLLIYPAKGWLLRFRRELYQSFLHRHPDQAMTGFFNPYNRLPFARLEPKWQVIFGSSFNLLGEESAKEMQANQNILQHYLSILLLYANQFHPDAGMAAKDNAATKVLQSFKQLLDRHDLERHPLEFYAIELGMPAGEIRQALKTCIDKRPEELMDDRLITKLEYLLALGNTPLLQIAAKLGFSNEIVMNIFFNRYHPISTADFRKRFQVSPYKI